MNEKGIEADSRYSHPLLSGLPAARAKKGKVVLAEEAVRVIRDGDTIATGGFVGIGFADSDPNWPVPADLSIMDFRPITKGSPRLMDARIFRPEPMGLKEDLLTLTLEERLTYDAEENLFFVNFEGFAVKTALEVQEIKDAVEKIVAPLSERVYTIVNYDNFTILPDVVDEYTDMVKHLVDNYYSGVTRYTTSTFLRMKLGDALKKRDVAPHIYESGDEARKALERVTSCELRVTGCGLRVVSCEL